jgi:hypothetical protein
LGWALVLEWVSTSQPEWGLEWVLESRQELESALALGWQEDLEREKR